MLVEKITNKKLFFLLIFIFLLFAVFIFICKPFKFENNEYLGVFFKRPSPLIVLSPQNNLKKSSSFLILIENETNINSFFSKLESKLGYIEGKMMKVSGKLLTNNETRFIEISDKLELISIKEIKNSYPSEQTKKKKINLNGKIVDLQCVARNDLSKRCFYDNLFKGNIPALRIFKNKEHIDYLLRINDFNIIENYLKNNFDAIIKVYGDYYYQNGFNVILLDSISSLK
tara:strand:- start:274 stop:960 length:687 start_codon:yes stop_codon:yes gene_type:complete